MSAANINLRKVINASGRMSILGVSTLSDEVIEAMKSGGQHYYEMEQLHEEAGKFISNYMNTEAALVTNSASSAIVLAIAGLITRNNSYLIDHLHESQPHLSREILIMMGHLVDYGAPVSTMIRLGGGEVRVVGYANGCTIHQIENAITEHTVGMLFVQSHHCVQKNMPSLAEVSALLKRKNIPLIVDAAAETVLSRCTKYAELVIISGSKAIEGPTSGILAGKKDYIHYAKQHNRGIGRAMKIGKESIFGLLKALKNYDAKEWPKTDQLELLDTFNCLNRIKGISVSIHQDESKREIYRARIQVDENEAAYHAYDVIQALKEGDVAVYTRDYHANNGYFEIDPRSLNRTDVELIINKINHIMGG